MGKDYPENAYVLIHYNCPEYWTACTYEFAKKIENSLDMVIIQTGQQSPELNYKPEDV